MIGLLAQGEAEVFDPASVGTGKRAVQARLRSIGGTDVTDLVLLRVEPRRLVWWEGWTSGTVTP